MDVPRNAVTLLPAEQLLRELLLESAQHFPGLDIWITGGWVRDRLLGIPSSDLDLALSNVTGRTFGQFLERFSARPDVASRYRQRAADLGIPDARLTRFHIMEKNAGAAKNLETAGGRLFGLDVDLVNLRKEVYNTNSRNPDTEFGTPEEDAFRRDATVNALFFHLRTQAVIDLTNHGLRDLQQRVMRTPLDPHQTFTDDPLRVLRLIRIGSRLDFALSPDAAAAMRDPAIHRALDTIITRDRIHTELFTMLRDPRPAVALRHLHAANLYAPVFLRLDSPLLALLRTALPVLGDPASPPWPATWPRAVDLLARLLEHGGSLGELARGGQSVETAWAMAAFAPLAGLRGTALQQVMREVAAAVRAPVRLTRVLEAALRNYDGIREVVDAVVSGGSRLRRSVVGMAIRSWGATWRVQVVYVLLAEAVYASVWEGPRGDGASAGEDDTPTLTGPLVAMYAALADYVADEGLWEAHALRPLLDGNEVLTLFGLRKGGRFLKTALDGLVAWQLDHAGAGVEEAKAWLVGEGERLGVPVRD